MNQNDETYHVVIRLPFKRPNGFVEPPSIVWTNEMEHKLWQYMSQKNTDWNEIAEQLGVPTSYVVRHAAFIYETQLRGIQQQLRMSGNNVSFSRTSTKSPTLSKPARLSSVRYSNTLQYQQQQQQSSHELSSQKLQQLDGRNSKELAPVSSNKTVTPRATTIALDPNSNNKVVAAEDHHAVAKPASVYNSNSTYKSSTSTSSSHTERNNSKHKFMMDDEDEDVFNTSNSSSNKEDSIHDEEDIEQENTTSSNSNSHEEEEEEEFSSHFERMKLQVEEPAFLSRKVNASSTHSLGSNSSRLSSSIQNLKKTSGTYGSNPIVAESSGGSSSNSKPVQNYSPATTAPGSSNQSAMNSVGSSFSDLSDSSVTQSALEDAFLSKFNQGSKMSLMNFSQSRQS